MRCYDGFLAAYSAFYRLRERSGVAYYGVPPNSDFRTLLRLTVASWCLWTCV
jgi:hypothetical protein